MNLLNLLYQFEQNAATLTLPGAKNRKIHEDDAVTAGMLSFWGFRSRDARPENEIVTCSK